MVAANYPFVGSLGAAFLLGLALTNLARKLGLDAEQALRDADDRFGRRFRYVEEALAAHGRAVADAPPDEQDRLWNDAKRAERG